MRTFSTLALAALAVVLCLQGCTIQSRIVVLPNSVFVPPGATVRELGPAQASMVHGVSILGFPPLNFETSELDRRIVEDALRQQSGANVLLNYALYVRTKAIPPLLSWGMIEVEGTAGQIIQQ